MRAAVGWCVRGESYFPQTSPIAVVSYIPVLVDTKKLEQQQCDLSELANAHVRYASLLSTPTHPIPYPSLRSLPFIALCIRPLSLFCVYNTLGQL